MTKTLGSDLWSHDSGFEVAHTGSATDPASRDRDIDVLVVDDDDMTRASFGSVLRVAGYKVAEAEDGFVALEWLRSTNLGCLLLEIDLVGLGGLRLLDRLDNPPAVILMSTSAYGTDTIRRRSKTYPFIRKPVLPRFLLAVVARSVASDRSKSLTGVSDGKRNSRHTPSPSLR